jgi:aryl-alcohol dehydrogenase-like predicted oxidoreductase
VIDRLPFGRTGHRSSRIIFGAAAFFSTTPERSERVLATLIEHGINHIDTAAGYGDSELHLAPWMKRHRGDFFPPPKPASAPTTAPSDRSSARSSGSRSSASI